jgi:uncharacterized protein YabE (DUF348 family)
MFKGFLKKIVFLVLISLLGWFIFKLVTTPSRPTARNFSGEKSVFLADNGLAFESRTSTSKIEDFLKEKNIVLQEKDEVIPPKNALLVSGQNIFIRRAVKIKIIVDGKTTENYTLASSVRDAILENNITLGRLDQSVPDFNSLPANNLKIVITRINVEEKIETEAIPFKTTEKTDAKLSWREKKIEQPGEKGEREVKYKITYKNGKEISRIILEKKITQDPITEIVIKGTYMELGKAAKGQGTWYAWKGGLFAASTTIPKGTFVKVTNLANSKTVVVEINDYGPQGKGRIIDLDKVAFAKIASLGAGVIGVKVERILN